MKKNLLFAKLFLLLIFISACSNDDDSNVTQEFVIAFENPSVSFSADEESKEVKLVFSVAAPVSGTAIVNYNVENAVYGSDFTTIPAGDTGSITVNITEGTTETTFTFNKLQNPIEGTIKSVSFSLESVSITDAIISGNTDLAVSFTESAALGGVLALETGGPTFPNQVYIDLSSQNQIAIRRDTWELAFYSGTENIVFLNPALRVTAAELSDFTDLNAVTSTTEFDTPLEFNYVDPFTGTPTTASVNNVEEYKAGVKLSYTMYGQYADAIDGSETAISEISTTDNENKVYLFYMGTEIPDGPGSSSTNVGSVDRGWYKLRVLIDGDQYKLQYAELDATSFNEVNISKDPSYNSVAYSMTNNEEVSVEPVKENWDINFSGVYAAENGPTYTDFVVHNTLGGTGLYQVTTYEINDEDEVVEFDVPSYEDFILQDVNDASFEFESRNTISSSWRAINIDFSTGTSTAAVRDDRFYILKDVAGNYYKLRFTAVVNENGVRGYPEFEYTLLQ